MTAGPLTEFASHLSRLAAPVEAVPDAELLRRFADANDQAAFELLVWRHAGLVLGTCRRALGRTPDADDAFQATFLALARKAASVRGTALCGWLHRVARRAALKVRAAAVRTRPDSDALADVPAPPRRLPDDTALVLDEEIGRLTDKLRTAFVLCELEGRTAAAVAAHLGCPVGTVLSRLSRARARLRERLTRRGLAPALVGVMIVRPTAELVAATARAAVPFAAGVPTAGAGAATAADVLGSLAADAARPAAVLAAVGIVLLVGVALVARGTPAVPPPAPPAVAVKAAPPVPARPAPVPDYTLKMDAAKLTRLDSVHFSPDGKYLVGGGLVKGDRDAVAVWEAATGKHVRTLTSADGVARWLTFAPDGKTFATPNREDNAIVLWDTATGKKTAALALEWATSMQFSPDGTKVAGWSVPFLAAPKDGLRVWDLAANKMLFEHAQQAGESFRSADFTPDGKALVVSTSGGAVRILDGTTGKVRHEQQWDDRQVDAAVAPDGASVLVWMYTSPQDGADPTGAAYLLDPTTGKTVRALREGRPVYSAAFSPDGKCVAAFDGRTTAVFDAKTGKAVSELAMTDPPANTYRLEFAAGGVVVLYGGTPRPEDKTKDVRTAALFDAVSGKELARITNAWRIALDPTGKTVAVMRDDSDNVRVRPLADMPKGK